MQTAAHVKVRKQSAPLFSPSTMWALGSKSGHIHSLSCLPALVPRFYFTLGSINCMTVLIVSEGRNTLLVHHCVSLPNSGFGALIQLEIGRGRLWCTREIGVRNKGKAFASTVWQLEPHM